MANFLVQKDRYGWEMRKNERKGKPRISSHVRDVLVAPPKRGKILLLVDAGNSAPAVPTEQEPPKYLEHRFDPNCHHPLFGSCARPDLGICHWQTCAQAGKPEVNLGYRLAIVAFPGVIGLDLH